MKRKPCEQCGRNTVRRVDGLAVCRACARGGAAMKRKDTYLRIRLRLNHFQQRHERRNVPGCPICDDRRAEDVKPVGKPGA